MALLHELLELGPKLLLFCFTFIIVGMSWLGHHRKFSYIGKVDGRLLWFKSDLPNGALSDSIRTGVLGERSGFGFTLYTIVMAVVEMLSAGLSAYGLRPPFLSRSDLTAEARQDMTLLPLLTAFIFLVSTAFAFGNKAGLAHWSLLAIVLVSIFFGARGH